MEQRILIVFFNLICVLLSGAHCQGLLCKSCQGVESPEQCKQSVICGSDENCFTREYGDLNRRHGYRLGCESQAQCTLFLNAASLVGKRHLPEPAPPERCYDCCSTDDCNSGLCRGSSYVTKPHSATPSTSETIQTTLEHTTTPVKRQSCPPKFVSYKDSCYLFDFKPTNWTSARSACQELGADLVSLHSKEENNFIAQQLRIYNGINKEKFALAVSDMDSLWTGGIYSLTQQKLVWLDGSPFNYANWIAGHPYSLIDHGTEYHVCVSNPATGYSSYKTASMWETKYPNLFGVICKKQLS